MADVTISEDYNKTVEEKRSDDFPQLKDACYLDHAGATLYSQTQMEAIFEEMKENLFANPHSQSSSSRETGDRIDEARSLVTAYFGVSEEEYSVVFTAGCTHALGLVGQALPLGPEGPDSPAPPAGLHAGAFVHLRESHTSVVGLREVFSRRGALVRCLEDDAPEFAEALLDVRDSVAEGWRVLCALPAQCNFSGHRFDPGLVQEVRESLGPAALVLLDAASLASGGPVELEAWDRPDLVTVSFYKIFGYPTGLGALLVRQDTAGRLMQKTYFGGGTQDAYLPSQPFHRDRKALPDRMEDGTVSFLGIPALKFGFDALNLYGDGPHWIARHVFALAEFTRRSLEALRHPNGAPVAVVYARRARPNWTEQSGVVAFNVLRPDGSHVGYSQVSRMSQLYRIHLRVGCFCNVGACQRYLGLTDAELMEHLDAGHVCGDSMAVVNSRPTGAVRVSFGYMSVLEDAVRLVTMIRECFVSRDVALAGPASVPETKQQVRLCQLCVYPVKSCGAIRTSEWPLGPKGLLYDREWLVVDQRGAPLTLSKNQKLGRIRPHIDLAARAMTLSAEGFPDIQVDLDIKDSSPKHNSVSRVCDIYLKMTDCGDEVAAWVSGVLGEPGCRLKRQNQERESAIHAGELSLNNQSHFLLINLETIRQLQEMLPDVLPKEELIYRFRANLIIDNMPPLREDELESIQIGEEVFKAVGPCPRCRIICVDSGSENMTKEPMKTIMKTKSALTFGTYFMRCDTRSVNINLQQKLVVTFKES